MTVDPAAGTGAPTTPAGLMFTHAPCLLQQLSTTCSPQLLDLESYHQLSYLNSRQGREKWCICFSDISVLHFLQQ